MSKSFLALSALASGAILAAAQGTGTVTRAPSSSSAARTSTIPLAAKTFSYPDGIPYQVDTDTGPRGTQQGYNVCNSTTENQESMCQTAFVNAIDDFCLWAPPEPNSIVGNTEGEMVAWCTKPGRGTRLIPAGALTGVQFTRAPSYVQVVGFVDQRQINIGDGDYGGEMDPHGADQRGNPLGGLVFSQAFDAANATTVSGTSNGTQWTQAIQWHNFMGANMFCMKACNPADANDWHYCEHVFDRIGCNYNAPADYGSINGTFTSCESENQQYPGVYVGDNNQTSTYTQPPESLGAISTLPYDPVIPSSSMCTTYSSAEIYTGLPSATSNATTEATAVSSSFASVVGAATSGVTQPTSGVRAVAAVPAATTRSTGAASAGTAVSAAVAGLACVAGLAMLF